MRIVCASSSSSASVAANATALRCSGVRCSSGVCDPVDRGGPRVGRQRREPDVAADDPVPWAVLRPTRSRRCRRPRG